MLAEQPALNPFAAYEGWWNRLIALAASRLIGHYRSALQNADASAVRAALEEHAALSREVAALGAQPTREKPLA